MAQPKKWRETIDPFSIKFKSFKLEKVLGYPHARNDVFYVKGEFEGKRVFAFLKCQRVKEKGIEREVSLLKKRILPKAPLLLEYADDFSYVLTKRVTGQRLSVIVGNEEEKSLEYMQEYGRELAQIHSLEISCEKAEERKFFSLPSEEFCKENALEKFREFLEKRKPTKINTCFCHGDMHYANVLWRGKKISGILDFELSGIGNKEFDIAWAIFRRPSQKFMKTKKEIELFLQGYKQIGNCEEEFVWYYIAQCYLHFYKIGSNDEEYRNFVYNYLKDYCK